MDVLGASYVVYVCGIAAVSSRCELNIITGVCEIVEIAVTLQKTMQVHEHNKYKHNTFINKPLISGEQRPPESEFPEYINII